MNSAHPPLSGLVIVLNLLALAGVTYARIRARGREHVFTRDTRRRARFVPGDVTDAGWQRSCFHGATCAYCQKIIRARIAPRRVRDKTTRVGATERIQ